MTEYLYNLEEEQNIARAVAKKIMQSDDMSLPEKETAAKQNYHQTLQKRALRFLKEMETILENLSNQEIANLLKVLLANGLEIESEEELEYWIARLEQQANLRLSAYLQMSTGKTLQANRFSDYTGMNSLLQSIIKLHYRRRPPAYDKENYRQWKKLLSQYHKVDKIIKKDRALARLNKRNRDRKRQSSSNTNSNTLDILESKMLSAGVRPNGEYWNEVISNYQISSDHMAFVENWSADQAKIDAENKKDSQVYEKSPAEKTTTQKETAQIMNHIMAIRGFENPRNQKIAEEAGRKKTEKTGQALTYEDIKKIKGQIVNGGR